MDLGHAYLIIATRLVS